MRDRSQQAAPDAASEEVLTPQAQGKFLLDDETGTLVTPECGNDKALMQSWPGQTSEAPLQSESLQQRVKKVRAAENPLLEAAQPLLRALSEMPDTVALPGHAERLKQSLKQAITLFSAVCDEVNIAWKKMAIVRYCLCTALDEAAHTTAWGMQTGWSQSNILNHFEGDNDGGNKFFLLVGRLSMEPQEYGDVLEVLLRILGLGFEGRYSILEEGDRQLTKIRQRLLTLMQSTRDSLAPALSPHGAAVRSQKKSQRGSVPVRVSLLLGGLLVGTLWLWCKYWLSTQQIAFQQRIHAMQYLKPDRPAATLKLRLATLLQQEIEQGLVSVDETQSQSKVVFRGDSVFLSGSDRVMANMQPIIKRVAKEVHRVKGSVMIVGHTDNAPIRTKNFPNNQVLSEKRATDVARYFLAEGIAPANIRLQGAGESQPVSSNQQIQGRAQNRRVEFFVTY